MRCGLSAAHEFVLTSGVSVAIAAHPPRAIPHWKQISVWMCAKCFCCERSIAGPIVCAVGDVASRSLVIAYSATAPPRPFCARWCMAPSSKGSAEQVSRLRPLLISGPCLYLCCRIIETSVRPHTDRVTFNGHPWWATCRCKSNTDAVQDIFGLVLSSPYK